MNVDIYLCSQTCMYVYIQTCISVPYIEGLSERFQNAYEKQGIQVYFKGGKPIKNLLETPKDKDPISKKWGNIQISI